MGVVMGPLPRGLELLLLLLLLVLLMLLLVGLPPAGVSASGACSWSELGSKFRLLGELGELRANEHWVLQMLSLRTASWPNSKISWGQLLILRD